jgi:hypothetical protein
MRGDDAHRGQRDTDRAAHRDIGTDDRCSIADPGGHRDIGADDRCGIAEPGTHRDAAADRSELAVADDGRDKPESAAGHDDARRDTGPRRLRR